MREVFSGKVAKVLDVDRVVINGGREHGVQELDDVIISHDFGEARDPDSQESLGSIRVIVGRGTVRQVEDKWSIVVPTEWTHSITDLPALIGKKADPRQEWDEVQPGDAVVVHRRA